MRSRISVRILSRTFWPMMFIIKNWVDIVSQRST